jgi:hypothetical protein
MVRLSIDGSIMELKCTVENIPNFMEDSVCSATITYDYYNYVNINGLQQIVKIMLLEDRSVFQ